MSVPKVAFVCVHNSCRSQIAEALCNHFAGDLLQAYSAGTELSPCINSDALRIVRQLYGIDMDIAQHPKLLAQLPPVDIVVTMGCNVRCPSLPCKHREDWGIDDPTGKDDALFAEVTEEIHARVLELASRNLPKLLDTD